MKLDVLAFGSHPDDIELGCGGTIVKLVKQGKKIGLIDLTQGELGTRGNAELRLVEAQKAQQILGAVIRENLNMADGFFEINKENKLKVVEIIRKYQPQIILANAITDRHIDHGKGAKLVSEAVFLAGLQKVKTFNNGVEQMAWRTNVVYHYIQDRYIEPNFLVNVTQEWATRMNAVQAFSSQFYDPNSTEPETPISSKNFVSFLESRAANFGRAINVKYAEGFTVERTIGVEDLFQLI